MALSDQEIAIAKGMIARGDRQHDIAAWFGENGGRIGEISKGTRGPNVAAAPPESLPPPGPYMAGRSALRARDTLVALRELIDEAIGDIDLYERAPERDAAEVVETKPPREPGPENAFGFSEE